MAEKLRRVTSVTPGERRTMDLVFSDGARLPVDLTGYIARYPEFGTLTDPEVFSRAEIVDGGVAVGWGGDAKISATTLRRAAEEQRPFTAEDLAAWMARVDVSNQEAADMLDVSLTSLKSMKRGDVEIPTAVAVMCRALEAEPSLMAAHFRPRITGRPRKLAVPSAMMVPARAIEPLGRNVQGGMSAPEWKPSEAIPSAGYALGDKAAMYRDSVAGGLVAKGAKRDRDNAQGKRGAATPGGKRRG